MAGLKGTGVCNATLDAWLGSTTLGPGTVYIALFTAAPTNAGGGTEVTGGGYARIAVTNNPTNFPAAAARTKHNAAAYNFGTAGVDWNTIVWAAAVKTSSGALGTADIIYAGPLAVARLVLTGDSFSVPVSGATFTEA